MMRISWMAKLQRDIGPSSNRQVAAHNQGQEQDCVAHLLQFAFYVRVCHIRSSIKQRGSSMNLSAGFNLSNRLAGRCV